MYWMEGYTKSSEWRNDGEVHIRSKREKTLQERADECKALEYSSHAAGLVADLASDIGSVGEPVAIFTAPIAAVAHVAKAGVDIASTALDCDDVPFDEIKEILEERFNELDRKLDKQTAALEEVSKLVSRTYENVEKMRKEMDEGFKRVLEAIEGKDIKSIVFRINNFIKYFDSERQRIKGLPKEDFVAKLQEQNGILLYLKDSRTPKGDSLSSSLNELIDKNNNYAIPKYLNDQKAFQALYALFYGTQAYVSVMFFLLEQHSYLADYHYQKGNTNEFNFQFDMVKTIFKDFKFSLVGGSSDNRNGVIYNVLEVLNTVKEKPFLKNADSQFYNDIINRTDILVTLATQIKGMDLPLIEDIPKNAVHISFQPPELQTPIGDWVDGTKVRYAVQFISNGMYSKLSEWSDPITVRGQASPVLKVPVDHKRRDRLIFRKFNDDKSQFVGKLSMTQTEFHDINRDLYNAAMGADKNIAVREVETLIKCGADINSRFDLGRSLMHAVAYQGNGKIALRFLLDNASTDINVRDKRGYTPLHISAEAGRSGFAQLLINHGADVNGKTETEHLTPLHIATRNGFSKTVKILLSSPNINVNQVADAGYTPLHSAVAGGYQVVNALLEHNDIIVNAKSKLGLTALHLATLNENLEVAESLVASKVDLNAGDINDVAALHFASMIGSLKMVKYFLSLKEKVNINAVTLENSWSPLHIAILFKREDVALELLKEENINLSLASKGNVTPLHIAVATGQANIVTQLLLRGGNLEEKTEEGYTPLHLGAMRKEPEMVGLLIKNGAALEARNADDLTPLHLAASSGRKNTLITLLNKGADIAAKTPDGSTALHLAVISRRIDTVKALLEKGANVKEYNNKYMPILLAMINDDLEMMKVLIDYDPSLLAPDSEEIHAMYNFVIRKLINDIYQYYINYYDELVGQEAIFKQFEEEGKLDMALFVIRGENPRDVLQRSFNAFLVMAKHCLLKKRAELGESQKLPANSLDSPNAKYCIRKMSDSFPDRNTGYFRRNTIPSEVSGNDRGYDHYSLNSMTHSVKDFNQYFIPFKSAEGKKYFQRSVDNSIENIDTNGTLLLLDVLVRKFTKEKHTSNGNNSASDLEAKALALDITGKFEELLTSASDVPAGEQVDLAEVNANIYKTIMGGNESQIFKILCSYVKMFSKLTPQQIEKLVATYMSTNPTIISSKDETYEQLPYLLAKSCLSNDVQMRSVINMNFLY